MLMLSLFIHPPVVICSEIANVCWDDTLCLYLFVCSDTLCHYSYLIFFHIEQPFWFKYMNELIRRGTPDKHAFPVCLRLSLHLRAVCPLLVVMEGERCPLDGIRQRWTSVWNVATQQDAESRRIKKPMLDVVFLHLLISLPSCQLQDERESLRILLLHSAFFRCATGLQQLPGSHRIIKMWSLHKHIHRGPPLNGATFMFMITLANVDRFQ